MAGIVLLSLLGWGLVYTLFVDDDDDSGAATSDESVDDAPTDPATEGADILDGTTGEDRIFGNGGDDLITGAAGDDELFGGQGTDIIFGEDGDDFMRGGADDDLIIAGEGEDTVYGDGGEDFIQTADILDEMAYLNSIPGADTEDDIVVNFDFDADQNEADTVIAGAGDDIVLFGSNDVVTGGSGADVLSIGDWMEPGQEAIVTDFDKDEDVLIYSYAEGATTPTVTFAENDDGAAEVVIDGQVALVLLGVDFTTLSASDIMLEERIT